MYFSYFYHFCLLSCNNDVIQPTGCKAIKTTPSNYIIQLKSNNIVFLSDLFSCFFPDGRKAGKAFVSWQRLVARIMPFKRPIGANNVSHRIKVDSN